MSVAGEDQNYPDDRKIQSVGEFQINDPIIYNNNPSKWGDSETFAKVPKLTSISIQNLGTVDLQNISLSAEYKYITFPLSVETGSLNNTALTATTATFVPAAPLPWPFWVNFKINVNQMNTDETIKLQITGVTLQNNDPDRTYSVDPPIDDYNNRMIVKCEKV